jgi:hypothetical protein
MAASAYEIQIGENELARLCDASTLGTQIDDLAKGARSLGLSCEIKYLVPGSIVECENKLIIAYLDYSRFVRFTYHAVLLREFSDQVVFFDPLVRNSNRDIPRKMPKEEFMGFWTSIDYLALVIDGKKEKVNTV